MDLQEATVELGDAFARAGFAPGAWRSPDAQLPALSEQLPNVRLEALLKRLIAFAKKSGPTWLEGGGVALDTFAHELRVLSGAIRPLRALSERHRGAPPAARGGRPLEQALGDVRVGTQLDRLARTLGQLTELAPLLKPLPSAVSAAQPAQPSQAGMVRASTRAGRAPGALGWPAQMFGMVLRRWHGRGNQNGERRLWRAGPSPRRRGMALGLVAGLLVLVVTASALALMHARPGSGGGIGSQTSVPTALARATASASSATRTAGPATPTRVTAPAPAQLAVSPPSVTLPCSGAGVTLTVSNTGGQALTWHASATGTAVLSATSGSVAAHGSATLSAHASGPQHGPGTITFTSNGGTATLTYKVSCH